MNNKILVEVIVPMIEERYQIFIPVNKRISSVILLLEKSIKELTGGYYPKKDDAILINASTGSMYDVNITVKESKMINGSKVILI